MLLTTIQITPPNRDWLDIIVSAAVPLLILVITLWHSNSRAKSERADRKQAEEAARKDRAISDLRQFESRVREIQYEGVKQAVVAFLRALDNEDELIGEYLKQHHVAPGAHGEWREFDALHNTYEELRLVVEPDIAKTAWEMEMHVRARFLGKADDPGRYMMQRELLLEYVRDYLKQGRPPSQHHRAETGATDPQSAPTPGRKKGPSKSTGPKPGHAN